VVLRAIAEFRQIAAQRIFLRCGNFALIREPYTRSAGYHTEDVQQPKNHDDHHDDIQDLLDAARHRHVRVDKPEYNPDYDQDQNYIQKGHATSGR
jgi:hypothetical protein